MRPCDHFEPELSAFLDGELPATEHGAVGAHVEACAPCARELERLRAVGVVLRRWDADETRYATTHAFRNRVLERLDPAAATAAATAAAPTPFRLILVRAAAAAVVLIATGAAVSLAWPRGGQGDLDELRAEIERWRTALPVEGTAVARAEPRSGAAPAITRLGEWESVVTPAEDTTGTRTDTAAAPEVWEEHGGDRIVQDAFSSYDRFWRERRELELLEELRRAQATAAAPTERPTTDEVPVTPLGRYLGSLQVAEGSYAPFQQVQVWPIVLDGASVGDAPLTAEEALALKTLRVKEGDGTLVIENRDRRGRSVLVLAGDVFQGGRQDRVVVEDVILEPGQTRSVRAMTTGDERRTMRRTYARSDGLAPHRVRALLARNAGQEALDRTVAASLPMLGAAGGDGSLAGVFDNDQLFSRAERYVRALLPRLQRERVVGFAVAAGDDLLGVEVFADHATFAAMRTRALRSYVLEALARPRLVGEPPERDVVVAALRLSGRAANTGTSGEVAAFLEPEARLGGYGLVTDGIVRHAVVFAGEHVDADGIAAGRLRSGFGDAPVQPDDLGTPETGTGPTRGSGEGGSGGIEPGGNR
jgi:anti-sigma factor RsiW